MVGQFNLVQFSSVRVNRSRQSKVGVARPQPDTRYSTSGQLPAGASSQPYWKVAQRGEEVLPTSNNQHSRWSVSSYFLHQLEPLLYSSSPELNQSERNEFFLPVWAEFGPEVVPRDDQSRRLMRTLPQSEREWERKWKWKWKWKQELLLTKRLDYELRLKLAPKQQPCYLKAQIWPLFWPGLNSARVKSHNSTQPTDRCIYYTFSAFASLEWQTKLRKKKKKKKSWLWSAAQLLLASGISAQLFQ